VKQRTDYSSKDSDFYYPHSDSEYNSFNEDYNAYDDWYVEDLFDHGAIAGVLPFSN